MTFAEEKSGSRASSRGVSRAAPIHPRSKQLLRAYLRVRPADACDFLFRGRRRTAAQLSGGEINRRFRSTPEEFEMRQYLKRKCGRVISRDLLHPLGVALRLVLE